MGDTLATLIEEVQYELIQVASPAVGQNFRPHITARIKREYRRLYHDYDWPHLIGWYDIETQAGERYYDFPDEAELGTTISIWRRYGNTWEPIDRGFDPDAYNAFDSDDDVRVDPVQRWRPYGAQVEFWPMPASNDFVMRFVAKRPFVQLVEESDICDLDTDLIVLHAAAQLARRQNKEEAALILGRASQHYDTLKSRNTRGGNKVNFSGSGQEPSHRDGFARKTIVGVLSGA